MKEPYRFKAETWVPDSPGNVFQFFQKAENLELLTPPWLKFKIVTPLPITMQQGALIDYQIKLSMVSMTWRTEISRWNPPKSFTDTQLRGPYRVWVHTHRFQQQNGGTLMIDEIAYLPPGGVFAGVINRFFVRKKVEQIFTYRAQKIGEIFNKK